MYNGVYARAESFQSFKIAQITDHNFTYGLTFAFGWSACVGPILGAILTALGTTGVSVLTGAALAFIYALGLATPLTLIATFFGNLGGARAPVWLRGRGFSLRLGAFTLHLHTTQIISGLMLCAVGVLLANGQLAWFTQQASTGSAARLPLALEQWLATLFRLGG